MTEPTANTPRRTPDQRGRVHRMLRRRARRVVRGARARVGSLAHGNRMWQAVLDAVIVAVSWWLAFLVRFDTGTPAIYQRTMFQTIGVITLIKVIVFVATGMYVKWWRYLSVKDMEGVLRSVMVASAAALGYVYLVQPLGFVHIPRSVAVLDFGFTLFLIAGVRAAARSLYERPGLRQGHIVTPTTGTRVLVVGAGEAGRMLVRETKRQQLDITPIGMIDDDDRKKHMKLDGVPVIGTVADIPDIFADGEVDEIVIAMPSASGATVQRIVDTCRSVDAPCRILPSLHELVTGTLTNLAAQLRTVQVEDILGREPVTVDLARIAEYVTDQTVLVTGAGGSIGSELCRQLARVNPARIVLVDHSEHNLFLIDNELRDERRFADAVPVVADISNVARMRQVFADHNPRVVFHAAAYKHVPMMERNPVEAVRNNAMGTQRLCEVAEKSGVDRFVLVSTDKAVEPQTVMGQSKALAEWIVQSFAIRSFHTRFIAVRFGNVLGSSGSVVPIFRRQIERGGPVTVTDDRMTRFFMTIPEAVQLIIQAGAIGAGGEVFVLDMGRPVKIIDLARNMIELSGRTPGVDIEIKVTGNRGGEKLDEELFAGDESVVTTSHEKIWQATSAHVLDADRVLEELDDLAEFIERADIDGMSERLREIMLPRIKAGARNIPVA